tara:strand:- start:2251 stop:3609 length:1359 start_codon:yes stop_codon:yes gene_type:complete
MPIVRQQKNETMPLNMPLNNAYSFKNGSSLIQLQIASQPQALVCKSLKLCGKLRLNRSTSTFAAPAFPNNNSNVAGGGGAFDLKLNERVGVNALIDTLTLSSMTGQTLESIRNYGRLAATTTPMKNNQTQFDGKLQGMNPACASRSKISANEVNSEVFFAMPLECGMIEGMDFLPLGKNGVDGLQILIQLASDQNAMQSSEGTASDCFFELVDVSLTYDTLVFDEKTTEEMARPASGAFEYNSWSHIYSVINASDAQQNFNFGTTKTLSVFTNTLPTTYINNISQDGFATNNLKKSVATAYDTDAVLKKITFIKDGIKVPLDFEVDCADQSTENRPRVEVISELKGAFNRRGGLSNLISINTENNLQTKVNLNGGDLMFPGGVENPGAEAKPVFAMGINEDNLTKVGRNFNNSSFGLRIETDLDGASPNSLNTFILSKNTLQYSPQGISVSS